MWWKVDVQLVKKPGGVIPGLIDRMLQTMTTAMKKSTVLASSIFILLAQSCSVAPAEDRERADKAELTSKAVEACECEVAKGKGDSPECWGDYKEATRPFEIGTGGGTVGGGQICVPITTEADCFKDSDGSFCITTRYYVKDVEIDEPRLCRIEEARAVEDAVAGVGKRAEPSGDWNEGDWDQKQAARAVKVALAEVRAGKAPKNVSRAYASCLPATATK